MRYPSNDPRCCRGIPRPAPAPSATSSVAPDAHTHRAEKPAGTTANEGVDLHPEVPAAANQRAIPTAAASIASRSLFRSFLFPKLRVVQRIPVSALGKFDVKALGIRIYLVVTDLCACKNLRVVESSDKGRQQTQDSTYFVNKSV